MTSFAILVLFSHYDTPAISPGMLGSQVNLAI